MTAALNEIAILKNLVLSGGIILRNLQSLAVNVPKTSDLPPDKVQASSTAHTNLDDVTQEVILQNLYSIAPDVRINVEESTPRVQWFKNNQNEFCFHLDPLDGTLSYVQQRDDYSIGAGFTHKTEFTSAAIYFPKADKLYLVQKGKGIKMENELGESLSFKRKQVPDDYYVQKRSDNYVPILEKMGLKKLDLMSAHHTMIAIAEGRVKVQIYNLASVHDFGISKLFVEEAGGICSGIKGLSIAFNSDFERVPYFLSFFDKKVKEEFFKLKES